MSTQTKNSFEEELEKLNHIKSEVAKVVVGQSELIERLLIAMLSNGHVLIEGVPGLAKTLTISTLAQALNVDFSRIQFTPDLLPGDVIGTQVYNQKTHEFSAHKGPVFANMVLADEINRSPAKVQSALLEAMQEKQVTIGGETYKLDQPFLVMATQNPVEQEGTYPLPEAQLDRFLFKLCVTYPDFDEEHEVMKRMASNKELETVNNVLNPEEIIKMREVVDQVFSSEEIERYIIRLVDATRFPAKYGLDHLNRYISHGVSPRASISLLKASKVYAMMQARDFVLPDDVKVMAKDVMRHRISISYKAEADEKTTDDIINELLSAITYNG
ncbi:MoxR family ATPase [Lentisphaera marina]|uniref:AAA family ATPase n=1 Tax=Lentisphaera marina TaxID=1111041 RepID=UPI002365BA76|nr:MoxR family ATPase [Lentisphaera marina]MDD7985406.1 MoxR family ATPase [Lentisphaera marina]